MSLLHQPLFLSTVNYHIGHTISVRVAEELGYYTDEGFGPYVFDSRGLLPGPYEGVALALQMEQRGVDVALGVGVAAALKQCGPANDLYIIGNWRFDGPAGTRWYSKTFRTVDQLRGARLGSREVAARDYLFLGENLRDAGIDPEHDVSWVFDPVFYADDPAMLDKVDSGEVDVAPAQPQLWAEAERRGFHRVLDTTGKFPAGRPGKVIVATGRAVRERSVELLAFLRANIRAFWVMRTPGQFTYLSGLDRRLRLNSHNDFEHGARLIKSPEMLEGWTVPLDGLISRPLIERYWADQKAAGHVPADAVLAPLLRDDLAEKAYAQLCARQELALQRDAAAASRDKYGY